MPRTSATSVLNVSNLGQIDYTSALALQRRVHARVADGEMPSTLLLLEHPHVYTLGRRGSDADILIGPERRAALGVEVEHVDRGGEVTYHGPGQQVGYPIINLKEWGGGPLKYVRSLESMLIATLAELGIVAESEDRPTGVWIGNAKIAAIGVRVSRGVTTHGFALNVDPDLSYFDHIVPCGDPEAQVTSVADQGQSDVDVASVVPIVARHFGASLGRIVEWHEAEELQEWIGATIPASGGDR
ncbi:MAG: lipoyl(octanoyl) transferase LipB [SAR202 cluster bacterium]|nr:lipoyl(octanoyl) transferase LipB [SAR202 cluster bacterium]